MVRLALMAAFIAAPRGVLATNETWVELAPPTRDGASMVFDAANDRMLLFGGSNGSAITTAVWSFSVDQPRSWRRIQASGTPPSAIYSMPAFYDSARARVVLIQQGNPYVVWGFSLTDSSWSQIASAAAPSNDYEVTPTFDPRHNRLLVFGGRSGSYFHPTFSNAVWSLPLAGPSAWTKIAPNGAAPEPRSGSIAVCDPIGDRLVIWGGRDQYESFSDAWALSFADTARWDSLAPGGYMYPTLMNYRGLFDPVHERLVLFGNPDNVWALPLGQAAPWHDIGNRFTAPPDDPATANEAIDPIHDQILYYGSATGSMNELSLSGAPTWTAFLTAPQRRIAATAVYDSLGDRMLVFGGFPWQGRDFNETLARKFGVSDQWVPLQTGATLPPPRSDHTAIYDPGGQRMVVAGGSTDFAYLSDTWSLSLGSNPQWSKLADFPLGPRLDHAAIYDPRRARMLIFGGASPTSSGAIEKMNDVWALSLTGTPAWTELHPAGTPPSRRGFMTAVYDAARDRMLIFGGADTSFITDSTGGETWSLDLSPTPTWERITAPGSPGGRAWHTSIYDPIGDRMLVFGGVTHTGESADVWSLSLATDSFGWTRLNPSGDQPPPRMFASSAYDSRRNRLVTYTGQYDRDAQSDPTIGDTWALNLGGDAPTPTLLSFVSAVAEPGLVTLQWSSESSEYVEAVVDRKTESSDWTALGPPATEGTDRLVFVDRSVAAGRRYAYRLEYITGATRAFTPEVWVETPSRLALTLDGLRPNPATDGLVVSFVLPSAAPASISLFDLAGRRILQDVMSDPQPGAHVMRLSDAGRVPQGIYWLELRQGADSRHSRAIVLH